MNLKGSPLARVKLERLRLIESSAKLFRPDDVPTKVQSYLTHQLSITIFDEKEKKNYYDFMVDADTSLVGNDEKDELVAELKCKFRGEYKFFKEKIKDCGKYVEDFGHQMFPAIRAHLMNELLGMGVNPLFIPPSLAGHEIAEENE